MSSIPSHRLLARIVLLVISFTLANTLIYAAPPQLVKDINPLTTASHSYPADFQAAGDTVLFNDIETGKFPSDLTVVDNLLFFTVKEASQSYELHRESTFGGDSCGGGGWQSASKQ